MASLVVNDAQSTGEISTTAPASIQGRAARGLLRWLPATVTVAFTVGILLAQETAPLDIARYALYLAWGLVLPGALVYRALRRVPHSLVDDLAMGTALGFVLELVAWAVYAAAGLQGYLWTWPAFVVVLFVAVPALRRHWRKPAGYRSASIGWSWTIAGIALALVTYLGLTFLYSTPVPRNEAHWFYLDGMYLLSIVADAMHHFPLRSPQVASEPLHYHWFTFTHMASSSLISGVDAPVIYFRFALLLFCLASVPLMAVVGWRVTGRPWVGALAAALMFVVAEFTTTDYVMFGMIGRWMIANSPSMCYAWLSTFPLIMVAADRILPRGLPDAPLGRGAWVLLAMFTASAAGAKSTILFVLLAGFGMAGLVELLRRRFPRNLIIATALTLTIIAASVVVLYGRETNGMRFKPLQVLQFYIPDVPRSTMKEFAVVGFFGVAYVVYMLARLAGIPVLAWLTWRRRGVDRPEWSVVHWFLLGAITSGVGGTLLLWHVTSAQVYLIRSAWPFGVLLSALGLAALVERYRLRRYVLASIVASGLVLATGMVGVLHFTGLSVPGKGSRFVMPVYWAMLLTVLVCAVIGAVAMLLRRSERLPELRVRGLGAVSILVLVLVMGVPVTLREIYHYARVDYTESSFYSEKVTPTAIAMTDWLKVNVPINDILATNGHCPAGHADQTRCLYLSSWLSAFSERRVVVGGWGYVPRSVVESSKVPAWIGSVPFFDPHKLAVNDAAFYVPTPAGLAELRDRYDADWLVVDRTVARESPALRELAPLRFERGDYAVYELR